MQQATCRDFIGIIAEDKPPLIFFRQLEDGASEKVKLVLQEINKDYPLLQIYEYIIDLDEQNSVLAENLGVDKTPLLVFYKNSNFNRYKDKLFTKKALATFIGNKKNYTCEPKSTS